MGNAADRPVVLFDFDGTLSDTTMCVFKTIEVVMARHGYSREQMGDLRRFIGPPLVEAFKDAYGFSQEQAESITAEYREVFDTWGPDDYPLFDGVRELLDALRAQGRRMAVATSRLEPRALTMLGELGARGYFDAVRGLERSAGRLSKVDAIGDALRELGAGAADAVMIGDSHFDIEGAAAYGIPCIGATWGETSTAEALAEAGAVTVCPTVPDLARILGALPARKH